MSRPVYKGGGLRIKEAVFVRNATTNVCMIMYNKKKSEVSLQRRTKSDLHNLKTWNHQYIGQESILFS